MNAALKLTCAAFGVCAGVWLAGSAYFLVGSRDAAPVEFPARQELAPEENAFSLFKDLDLHRQRQTNFNFSVAYRYINGRSGRRTLESHRHGFEDPLMPRRASAGRRTSR